ncbi:MAG: 4Fe-4S dicluster domain-containing protein [Anaerotruncus sp.]|nr:4Fe-4S dicluster domain-containing protein [Anaerotruncus sp.]
MIEIRSNNKQLCCGCSACAQICLQKCIVMQEDEEGFAYPYVDLNSCIDCKLCEKVCPIIQKESLYLLDGDDSQPKALGGWHKDDRIRFDSSSGGAFTLFAEYILAHDGIVYGCALNESFQAEHIGIETIDDLKKLRGSKYIQSITNGIYKEIEEWLQQDRLVLFTGTPCQAAGLQSFLHKQYTNLYVIDFICHGVPSPKVFQSYIKTFERRLSDKIISFRFRCKDLGWNPIGLQLGTEIKTEKKQFIRLFPGYKDAYMNGFLDDIYLRPSCYACEFKCLPKYYSDLTIADFWGVRKIEPTLFDGKGTSLLLLHNAHGESLFEQVKKNFFYKECDFRMAIQHNQSLIKSVDWNFKRNKFFKDYAHKPFEQVQRKYMSASVWISHKAVKIGWNIFERILYKVINTILKLLNKTWTDAKWQAFNQFIRFSIVGLSNVVVSYSINILVLFILAPVGLTFDYIVANIIAFILSVLWSFYWNNRLVFALKQGEERSLWNTLGKTYLTYSFTGIVLNNFLSTLWIYGLGLSKYIVPLCNLPINVPINFLLNKFWSYKTKKI